MLICFIEAPVTDSRILYDHLLLHICSALFPEQPGDRRDSQYLGMGTVPIYDRTRPATGLRP